ncbi:MAG: 7-cyano-7-deazaguanine synthase [Acidobacteria bacterium]|nr:7-cyano-7-deazaguanine synthase [Acidobacteriota bacterium]
MYGQGRYNRVAVLTSGGLDSLVLLDELARKYATVFPIYIRGGSAWERAELHWLKRFLYDLPHRSIRPIKILTNPMSDIDADHWSVTGNGVPGYYEEDPACYIPGRNIMLLAKTAVYCATQRIEAIAMAQLKGNPFPDSTPSFFRRLQSALSLGLKSEIKIISPYLKLSKIEVIRRGRGLALHRTFSCMRPVGLTHCGVCTKCAERRKAFQASGVADATRYAAKPPQPLRHQQRGSYARQNHNAQSR